MWYFLCVALWIIGAISLPFLPLKRVPRWWGIVLVVAGALPIARLVLLGAGPWHQITALVGGAMISFGLIKVGGLWN